MGKFDASLSVIDRTTRQKINKEIEDLHYGIKDLTGIYSTLHSTIAKYTFFTSARGAFSRIDHILDQETSLNRYRSMKILKIMSLNTIE